jgi:hypothetical protein
LSGAVNELKSDTDTLSSEMADITNNKLPAKVDKSDYVANNAFATTSGTSTAYTVTLSPAPTAYTDGQNITIVPHVDCGATPTLNINGLGALTIVKQDGTALVAGDLKVGKPYGLVRVGSNFFIRSGGGKYDAGKIILDRDLQISVLGGSEIWSKSNIPVANDIAFDSKGYIYIACASGIFKLDNLGNVLLSKTDVFSAEGIAVDGSGNIYVAYDNYGGNKTVRKLDSTGTEIWSKTDVVYGQRIAVDGNGYVYVIYMVSTGKTIRKLDSDGNEIWSKTNIADPYGFALDNSGYIYVGYSSGVVKLDNSGNQIWNKTNMHNAMSVAIDDGGYIYAGYGNTIVKLDSSGNQIWSVNLTEVYNIVVDNRGSIFASSTSNNGSKVIVRLDNNANEIWSKLDTTPVYGIAIDNNGYLYASYTTLILKKINAYTTYNILR